MVFLHHVSKTVYCLFFMAWAEKSHFWLALVCASHALPCTMQFISTYHCSEGASKVLKTLPNLLNEKFSKHCIIKRFLTCYDALAHLLVTLMLFFVLSCSRQYEAKPVWVVGHTCAWCQSAGALFFSAHLCLLYDTQHHFLQSMSHSSTHTFMTDCTDHHTSSYFVFSLCFSYN